MKRQKNKSTQRSSSDKAFEISIGDIAKIGVSKDTWTKDKNNFFIPVIKIALGVVAVSVCGNMAYRFWSKAKDNSGRLKATRLEYDNRARLMDKKLLQQVINHFVQNISKRKNTTSHEAQNDEINGDNTGNTPDYDIRSLDDVVNSTAEIVEIVFAGYTPFPHGSRNLLYGPKKSGKTILATMTAQSISGALDNGLQLGLTGRHSGAETVDYYDLELRGRDYQLRYSGYGVSFQGINRIVPKGLVSWQALVEHIRERVFSTCENRTIIIDNLKKIRDLNSDIKFNQFDDALKCIQHEAVEKGITVTIIALLHTTKDGKQISGPANIGNFFENIMRIEKKNNDYILSLENCRQIPDGEKFYFRREEAPLRLVPMKEEKHPGMAATPPSVKMAPSVRKVIDENFKVQLLEEHEHDKKSYAVLWDKYVNQYDLPTDKYKGKNKVRNLIVEARKLAKAKDCPPM